MKKMLCVLLTLSLLFCATALAANGTYDQNDQRATTTLTTIIAGPDAPTYTIIIPSTLTITPNATSTTLYIRVTEMENANSVKVTTNANGSMSNGTGGTLGYTVTSNTLQWSKASQKWMNIEITAEQWQQTPAGDYTGTMSFTISAE